MDAIRSGVNPRYGICVILPFAAFGLGACAIHPVPEDVTGVKTTQIVHRIRCETWKAVDEAHRWFKKNHPEKVQTVESVGIVYSFALAGTETNSLMASATVTKPLTHGSWSYTPSLGDSLMRENTRAFTVIDNYKTLKKLQYCDAESTGPNYQYPIVGTIGIREMTFTFFSLTLDGNLEAEEGTSVTSINTSAKGPPTMVDTISFTTTVSAGVSPTIMLTPATAAAHLASGSLTGSVGRTDNHQVVIGLAIPTASAPPTKQANVTHPRFGLLVSGYPQRNAVEDAALEAVNEQILRFEVPRPLITTD
jgi:hypothetical protein